MAKGYKTGGRVKGTPNKNRKTFISVLTDGKKAPFKELIGKQVELARGIFVEKDIILPDGTKLSRVYKQAPDQKAGQFLIEQVIGKATQAIEVSETPNTFDADKYLKP